MSYGLIVNDGGMTRSEFLSECFCNKWLPLLSEGATKFGPRKIVLFDNVPIAKSFMERNLKSLGWMVGYMEIETMHLQAIERQNLACQTVTFPRKAQFLWIDVLEVSQQAVFQMAPDSR